MWSSATPVAGGWYHDLGLWWSDPMTDQRVAGLVVVSAAVATAVGWTAALRRSVQAERESAGSWPEG